MERFFGAAQWIIVIIICLLAAGLLKICQAAGRVIGFFRRRPDSAD